MDKYNNFTQRYNGFADVYDYSRPQIPTQIPNLLIHYLGKEPYKVIDLRCGTGLSTNCWSGKCINLIGIEPITDMIIIAKRNYENIEFLEAMGNEMPQNSNSADVIVCSQSFHWMEPISTLN